MGTTFLARSTPAGSKLWAQSQGNRASPSLTLNRMAWRVSLMLLKTPPLGKKHSTHKGSQQRQATSASVMSVCHLPLMVPGTGRGCLEKRLGLSSSALVWGWKLQQLFCPGRVGGPITPFGPWQCPLADPIRQTICPSTPLATPLPHGSPPALIPGASKASHELPEGHRRHFFRKGTSCVLL